LQDQSQMSRRYTEAEAKRTGLVVSEGYRLIGTLFDPTASSN
jgi:hypothetical protein